VLGGAVVTAALDDWRTAPLEPRVRGALGFLEKLTLTPEAVGAADLASLRAAGASDEAIEDAVRVCALFSIIDRVADALGFELPSPASFDRAAKLLLRHGYGK
jgi:alkylhydroperoxidase family enzyme